MSDFAQAKRRILVVDDYPDIRDNIREYLEMKGYAVTTCPDIYRCQEEMKRGDVSLLILDIGLPGIDGLEYCRSLRAAGNAIPVLMLTARDTVDDRVEGLSAGADDYLVKPFALRELAARIEALERRACVMQTAPSATVSKPALQGAPATTSEAICLGDVLLDEGAMRVMRAGKVLRINPTGLKILSILMHASPRVVSRAALEERAWPEGAPASDSLRSNLYLLRQALEKGFPELPPVIETHPGFGWAFRPTTPTAPK